ncbi:MAG: hypothetical protein IKR17_02935 [Bacteroidales bacterium]|nr:hypothetical protein [Bacteroidales bacterium]
MKRTILLLMVGFIFAFASCDKDDDNGKLDPNAKIYISGVDKLLKNTRYGVDAPLTAHEICRLDSLWLVSDKVNEDGGVTTSCSYFSFSGESGCTIDTINNRLVFNAGNINGIDDNWFLDPSTGFNDYYIYRDVLVYDERGVATQIGLDTLAYIPNAQRQAAYEQIKALWDTENWDAIYEIFQNAFTFVPCTGKEFRELKEAGLN